MSAQLSEQEAERILERLEELEAKIDEIKRNVDVMMQIHELLHPEELARARMEVERSKKEDNHESSTSK